MNILGIPFLFFLPQKPHFLLAFFERKFKILFGYSTLPSLPAKFLIDVIICGVYIWGILYLAEPI
jgi:hypothetical protein